MCTCVGHNKQLDYRDEMVGTQLVAGALNKEHQAKVLSETANLHSLEDKLNRLCALEKSVILCNAQRTGTVHGRCEGGGGEEGGAEQVLHLP